MKMARHCCFFFLHKRSPFSFQKFLRTKRTFIATTQVISKKVVLVQRSSILKTCCTHDPEMKHRKRAFLEVLQTKSQRCPPRKNDLNLIQMRKPEMFYTQVPEMKHCAVCQRCQPLSTELSGQYKPPPPPPPPPQGRSYM